MKCGIAFLVFACFTCFSLQCLKRNSSCNLCWKTHIETPQEALPCLWIAYADVKVNAKKLMKPNNPNKSRSQILSCIKEMICYQTYHLQRIMSVYSEAYEQSAESSSTAPLKIMDDFSSDKEGPSKWYLLPWSRLSDSKYVTVAEKLWKRVLYEQPKGLKSLLFLLAVFS